MEKHWQYLIIFLIGWILFIFPNELMLKEFNENKLKPIGNNPPLEDSLKNRIFFALGLFGLMLMIISYGNIKGIMDKQKKM